MKIIYSNIRKINILNKHLSEGLIIIPPFNGMSVTITHVNLNAYLYVYVNETINGDLYHHLIINFNIILDIYGIDEISRFRTNKIA